MRYMLICLLSLALLPVAAFAEANLPSPPEKAPVKIYVHNNDAAGRSVRAGCSAQTMREIAPGRSARLRCVDPARVWLGLSDQGARPVDATAEDNFSVLPSGPAGPSIAGCTETQLDLAPDFQSHHVYVWLISVCAQ